LPVFGQLTPFPATPLYDRLQKAGRLVRPKHWLDFAPFVMAHNPLHMTINEAREETKSAWSESYSPKRNAEAVEAIADAPLKYRISMFVARLFFRGIYFPQLGWKSWTKVIWENRGTILRLVVASIKRDQKAAALKVRYPRPANSAAFQTEPLHPSRNLD
jgi:hypothetical protein